MAARKLGLFYCETLPGNLLLQWCLTPFLSTQGAQRKNQRAAAGDASCGLWPSLVMSVPPVCSSHSPLVIWWECVRFCGSFSFIPSCPFPRLSGSLWFFMVSACFGGWFENLQGFEMRLGCLNKSGVFKGEYCLAGAKIWHAWLQLRTPPCCVQMVPKSSAL